jgi:hypothetical protein
MLLSSIGMFSMIISGIYLLKIAGGKTYEMTTLPYLVFLLFLTGGGIYWFSMARITDRSYFLIWDQHHVSWLLPGQKRSLSVYFKDIKSLNINRAVIEISLHTCEVLHLNLGRFFITDKTEIRKKFESLKTQKMQKTEQYAILN